MINIIMKLPSPFIIIIITILINFNNYNSKLWDIMKQMLEVK